MQKVRYNNKEKSKKPGKKKKALIIIASVMSAIMVTLSVLMIVSVVKSKKDQTVASGTLSMLGNFLRIKSNIEYETFGDEALYPVEDFRVSMSAMNHWGIRTTLPPTGLISINTTIRSTNTLLPTARLRQRI